MIFLLFVLVLFFMISFMFFYTLRVLGESEDELFEEFGTYNCKPNLKKWLNVVFKVLHFIFVKVPLTIVWSLPDLPSFEFIWKSEKDTYKETK